jgi:hypothetical protein
MSGVLVRVLATMGVFFACTSTPAPESPVSSANQVKALKSISNGLENLRPRLQEIVAVDSRTALFKQAMLVEYGSIQALTTSAITGKLK